MENSQKINTPPSIRCLPCGSFNTGSTSPPALLHVPLHLFVICQVRDCCPWPCRCCCLLGLSSYGNGRVEKTHITITLRTLSGDKQILHHAIAVGKREIEQTLMATGSGYTTTSRVSSSTSTRAALTFAQFLLKVGILPALVVEVYAVAEEERSGDTGRNSNRFADLHTCNFSSENPEQIHTSAPLAKAKPHHRGKKKNKINAQPR